MLRCLNLPFLLHRTKGTYSKTINAPKFPFSIHPVPVSQSKLCSEWLDFCNRRSATTHLPIYVLHDGPPYANGDLHIGHALNKFLKDVIVRYKLLSGFRVHFIPGWDCHGLPIELKAIESSHLHTTACDIREKAHKVAAKYIRLQKATFEEWGVLADWPNYYCTMHPSFQKAELTAFATLHAEGFVCRDLLPVHWSPEAKTALAESELEYNSEHVSPSVYIRLLLANMSSRITANASPSASVYTVIWTTTPWTLPSNEAVLYDEATMYVMLKNERKNEFYVVSDRFSSRLEAMLSCGELKRVDMFLGSDLQGCSYFQPFWAVAKAERLLKPFLPGTHVTESKGTGLVHCAPCHGKEDFAIGRQYNLSLNQYVDEHGRFTKQVGSKLSGLAVHDSGNQAVIDILAPEILLRESIKHNYPYDWRTHTPVITRLSDQWFIDTDKLTPLAVEKYEEVIVIPSSQKASLLPFISSRPRWCISRQRSWGLPIPVLLNANDGLPIVDYEFIRHVGDRVGQSGANFWFEESLSKLVPDSYWEKWGLSPEEVRKSTDVFDVWFDSGLSWLAVLQNSSLTARGTDHTMADLYLEGQDQFRGWFSSSLLLSIALRKCAPFKSIIVHGMATDSTGRKMSKSLGNVVSPDQLLTEHNGCVDILRHWAVSSALETTCAVGSQELDRHANSYKSLRNSLRFMVGNLSDFRPAEFLSHEASPFCGGHINLVIFHFIHHSMRSCALSVLDRAMLGWLGYLIQLALKNYYPNCRYATILADVDRFLSTLSSIYMTSVKDALYCDPVSSRRRQRVQSVFFLIIEGLKALLAPLTPFLMEEVESASKLYWEIDHFLQSSTTRTLLERYSRSVIVPGESTEFCPTSDWSSLLSAMGDWWPSFKADCETVDLLRTLYLSVINQLISSSMKRSGRVSPLLNFHLRLVISSSPMTEQLIGALQNFQTHHTQADDNSDLCDFFRCASIQWALEGDNQLHDLTDPTVFHNEQFNAYIQLVEADPAERCPRCLRFTRVPTSTLCDRCAQALATNSPTQHEQRIVR